MFNIAQACDGRVAGVLKKPIDGGIDFLGIELVDAAKIGHDLRAGFAFLVTVGLTQLKVAVGFAVAAFYAYSCIHSCRQYTKISFVCQA